MTRIKLALLGIGDVAQRDYLPEFQRLADRAEIVAAAARTPERLNALADQYNIPHRYTDYHQMLAEISRPGPTYADAVINLTPIQIHTETTLAALEAGKHVYTEKPIASTVAEADRIRAAARANGRILVCAPCVRIFPQVRYAAALLAQDAIGPVYAARAHALMGVPPWSGYPSDPSPFFAAGAGAAYDMGVYPLHTLTSLLGPVQRVNAFIDRALDQFVINDGPLQGKIVPVESPDNWHVVLDFGEKRLGSFQANSVVAATRAPSVEIFGLRGTIALDPIDVSAPVELYTEADGWQTMQPPFPIAHAQGRAQGPDHHLGIEHLVDCIAHGHAPLLSADHAIHVVEILEKSAHAAETGRVQTIENTFAWELPRESIQ
ncbi:MAG: Gfo/Idh/MocA family oxidoreductase [Litorilinea sp.]